MIDPEVHIICGMQFGSEGKRLFLDVYSRYFEPDVIVTNAYPNSGGYDGKGKKWSAIPCSYHATIMISPGSAINMAALRREGHGKEVLIHKNAAVVNSHALEAEKELVRIGSTMTGGMEAVVTKMRRNSGIKCTAGQWHLEGVINNDEWFDRLLSAKRILVFVAQGHSLSLNFGMWPHCTSRNTSPQQALADAGIPIQWVKRIIGCARTYPIRVANRYDDNGNMIGWSGPCYPDQKEITWEDIGVPPEYTSISKKKRRVFTFSVKQYKEALLTNGITDVFLNFMNYDPDFDVPEEVSWWGWGPKLEDIEWYPTRN